MTGWMTHVQWSSLLLVVPEAVPSTYQTETYVSYDRSLVGIARNSKVKTRETLECCGPDGDGDRRQCTAYGSSEGIAKKIDVKVDNRSPSGNHTHHTPACISLIISERKSRHFHLENKDNGRIV